MAGGNLGERLGAAEETHGLLRPAVHRIVQLQLLDAEVVIGARFDEQVFHRARGGVAPRLDERHRRRLIVEDVDRVLRRGVHLFAVRTGELDLVEALTLDLEAARQRPVRLRRQHRGSRVVQQNAAAGRGHRRHDAQEHFRAA